MRCIPCDTDFEIRRKRSLRGQETLVWQCPKCLRGGGAVGARDVRELSVADLYAVPRATHRSKPRPNSKRRDYQAVLRSARFRELREQVIAEAGGRCQMDGPNCLREATQAHHKTYDRLGNERKEDLVAACSTCNAEERQQRITRQVLGS